MKTTSWQDLPLFPGLRGLFHGHDIAYVGWFGQIGIAAIYYATFAGAQVHDPVVWHATSALIFASIVIHGATAAPFTRLYARRAAANPLAARELEEEPDTLAVGPSR